MFETISKESPMPKRNNPRKRIANLRTDIDQGEIAVHGVTGTVLLGLKKARRER
jgi:hypothetical protein